MSLITAAQIQDWRTKSDDYESTQLLKSELASSLKNRSPVYLTAADFDKILRWKLLTQFGRQEARRRANTDEVIRRVTGLALGITHENKEYEIELRVGILCALRGVGVPVASAVLALTMPEQYGVIDFRGWRQVIGCERTGFTIGDYKRYLRELKVLADELRWPVQEVDLAIWAYDRAQD